MKILYHTPTQTLRDYPRQDDEPVVGLDPSFQTFDLIQQSPPVHNPATHYLRATEQIDTVNRRVTRGWEVLEQSPVNTVISVPGAAFFQAIGRDMEIRLRAKIAEETDLNKRHFLSAFLSYPYFQSDHPMVLQFGALLGKSPEEIRGYFEQAKAIAYP
jgi:hypothetical protein